MAIQAMSSCGRDISSSTTGKAALDASDYHGTLNTKDTENGEPIHNPKSLTYLKIELASRDSVCKAAFSFNVEDKKCTLRFHISRV